MAAGLVSRRLVELGAQPVLRQGFVTDNGNVILDASGLTIDDPTGLEGVLDGFPGVVTSGLFARRGADVVLVAAGEGVRRLERAKGL